MAGGIPISAKFDVAIAEPLDSKLESVSTFSELASTPFPYKGMQKLVEDEGVNGVIYYLGKDLVTWATSTEEDTHTVTDFTDAFTIPNGTNNATLTMTNPIDKDVTITTTSFANVGDACELSSLIGVGYPIVLADTGVALVDPNGVASDSFNIKGLRRMNDLSGIVQIQVY